MVDKTPIHSEQQFVEVLGGADDCELNDGQIAELWDVWKSYCDAVQTKVLVMVPEWFSENEFDGRRPYVLATVEHDDPDSGAVLFGEAETIDISIVENQALTDIPRELSTEELDVSDDDDYIDEAGKVWIPRSLMTVFKRAG